MKNMLNRSLLLGLIIILALVSCDERKPSEVDPDEITYYLNLTSDQNVIYADNGKTVAHLTAILTNEVGEPQQGATIVFSVLTGAIASNISTNSSGQAIATFDDKGQSATHVPIVARYSDSNNNTVRDTVYLDILPMEALVSSFFASTSPGSGEVLVFQEDTTYSAYINANVRDSAGVAVRNVQVNYRVLEGMDIGYLDVPTDSTNELGTSRTKFTNNEGQIGTIRVEAYVTTNAVEALVMQDPGVYDFGSLLRSANSSGIAFTDTVTLNYTAGQEYYLSLNTLDTTIYADDGETVARIYAVVKDGEDEGIDTIEVKFTTNIGTISSPRYTNDAGVAETEFSDLGANISSDVMARIIGTIEHPFYGRIKDTIMVAIRADNPNVSQRIPARIDLVSECSALPSENPADGCLNSSTLVATVMDSSGYPVEANTLVTFETDIGFVTQFSTTNAQGQAVSEFTIGDSAGIATIYARSGGVRDSTLINVRPGLPTYIVIPPVTPNRIVVAGGYGIASTTIRAEVRDARGELVDIAYPVTFTLGPAIPAGANLDGVGPMTIVESNHGIAAVTLNSGTQSGPVRITARTTGLVQISATAVPVSIAAGPPAYIDADIDINQIDPIGGGQYQAELAARVWDAYTNPVEDSTQIYWHIEPSNIASVIGGSLTYDENLSGDTYHGLAWSLLYWNSDRTFDTIQVIAQTYGANGDTIQGYINAAEDSTLLLPFYPGELVVIPSLQFHDFQPAANPNPALLPVTLTAMLTDYYNNPIKNGRILFGAIGAAGWDPTDAGGNPIVATDDSGVAVITVFFNANLCTPNFNNDGTVNSYNPFTAFVWGTLLDPQSISSEQVSIELRRSIQ